MYYTNLKDSFLVADDSTLNLLVTTDLEALASADNLEGLTLAGGALKTKNDLLGGLGLLVEDRLGLTSVTGLLSVVTTLTLGDEGSGAGLVLGNLLDGVLSALGVGAEGLASLGDVDLLSHGKWVLVNIPTLTQVLGGSACDEKAGPKQFYTTCNLRPYFTHASNTPTM
jgi:hypothetical protein